MKYRAWIAGHKSLLGAVATAVVGALLGVAGAVSPPWDQLITAVAITLAALSGGPMPALPPCNLPDDDENGDA